MDSRVESDAESTRLLVLAIRDVGRKNLDVLKLIAARLKSIGIDRTLVRILDALLRLNKSGEPSGAFP